MRLVLWPMICALAAHPATARDQAAAAGAGKQASASRVADGAIRVDGRLDEEAWLGAAPITDFVQKEPTEGAPPTDAMEVRFVYDDSALYVGARMFSRREGAIQAPLARRDNGETQSEYVLISLDTFLDRRTAYDFGVTASGVRLDRYHPTDREDVLDAGFNPVWEAKTAIGPDGWTAELWIPLSQLRFNPQRDLVWGLNIRRFRPTLDEDDYWVLVARTKRVWASRFGDLQGISAIRPTRRIELLPYVASASTVRANRDPRNPFDDGKNLSSRVGADVKMGIGTNLTLDATVNPDFGQVEADPAEVNLSAFETRFPEKRPFFTEGAQLLNINHPNFFYSRRIGARPRGGESGDFVDYPSSSTILAAAKLSRDRGGSSRDLRQPLRLLVHRPQHHLDRVPPRVHAQARHEPRRLRRTVRVLGALLRLRRAPDRERPRSPAVRHRRDDDCGGAGRQPRGHLRRCGVHAERARLQRAFVPQQRRAAVGVASGQSFLRRQDVVLAAD